MHILKIFRNEDSLDDFDNRRRARPDSKYITFSGLAKNAVRDGVEKILNKKNILNPWIGAPGLRDFRFGLNVRNKEKDVRGALAALNALGERNTWFIQYNDGDNIVSTISDFSPDIPNDLWYSGDMDKIVNFIMPKKGKAEASDGANEGAIKEYLEYEKGYKNSRGEDAPWVIRDHKGGKVLASFAKKDDAEAHLERMRRYSKDEVADSVGFSRFVQNLLDAAINMFDDATWDRLVKDYDFGDDFEKGRSVADSLKNMQGWVLTTEKRHTDEKLFNKDELERFAMNNYKAAVKAAWSAAGVKNFKIDIRSNDGEPPTIDVWPKTLDGKDIDVSWRILPKIFKIAQYSISRVGNHDIEREMDYRTEDDVENIFTDEFKNLDAVMDDGKPAKTETAPDDYARDNFLKGALDYAEIEDDKGNVVLLKITKRYANEIGGDFCLRSYDGETDKSLAMGGIRYVVDRYGEFIDMDPAEAIIKIAKE